MADERLIGDLNLFEGRTGDSEPPEMPGVGEWKDVMNPDDDLIFLEIQEYCTFKRLFTRYLRFLSGDEERPLQEDLGRMFSDLFDTIDKFPTTSQLLYFPRWSNAEEPVPVRYHTSYVVWSDTAQYTRSGMLAQLPAVVRQMQADHPIFAAAMTGGRRTGCQDLCTFVVESFEKWEWMAKENMEVPFRQIQTRQCTGSFKNRVKLDELLLELKLTVDGAV